MQQPSLVDDLRSIATLPRAEIVISRGAPHEEELLGLFTQRHPRYRVMRRKTIGVALLDLTEIADRDDYLAKYAQVRRMERKASKAGYTVRTFDPDDHRPELHAIHTSSSVRQGREMEESYVERAQAYRKTPGSVYLGGFHDDTLIAYLYLIFAGDIAMVSRHIGHADHLNDGVMYLLTTEAVAYATSREPRVRYLMHDTYFGAAPGLRFFKAKNGFLPHRVRWKRDVAG